MTIHLTDGHTELSFQYMQVEGNSETLLQFLLRRFRYLDESEWRQSIRQQRLWVDNRLGRPSQRLRNHQRITYLRPDFLEPEVDENFEVVYEDDALIAFNKSGNLPTSPSGKYFKHTLVNLAKQRLGRETLLTLHRLDRETSGVVAFAKHKAAAQKVAEHFRNRQIHKTYQAILSKHLPEPVTVDQPIGPALDSVIRIKQAVTPQGKPSQTHFQPLDEIGDSQLVEVRPLTGRTKSGFTQRTWVPPFSATSFTGLRMRVFCAGWRRARLASRHWGAWFAGNCCTPRKSAFRTQTPERK